MKINCSDENKKRELRHQRIQSYLISSNSHFFDGGMAELIYEQGVYRRSGIAFTPIYLLGTKARPDKDAYLNYTMDPMADSVSEMMTRIIIW